MAFFSGGGQKAGFEFFKHFIKQQFDSSRMYQTIRVIRPKPKESSIDSYLSSMKQMPPSRCVYQNYSLFFIKDFKILNFDCLQDGHVCSNEWYWWLFNGLHFG